MIKTAVIGAGYLGEFHAEKYGKSTSATLAAVVDIDFDRAKKVSQKWGAKPLADYRGLLELGVQCASVVTWTSAHFEVASWCLANGIDVLVEKPMTVSTDEGLRLINAARQYGRILAVGHVERFNPAFRAVEKYLTEPRFFEVRRIAQFAGRGIDVDVVRDLMIHDIDIVVHLVKKPIARVEAVGIPVLTGSIDIANARLTFEGGAVANVTASRAAFKTERTIRIFQPELYVSLDFGNRTLKISKRGTGNTILGFPKIDVEEHSLEERDSLGDEIEAFLKCVKQRSSPVVAGEDGLRALKLAERISEEIEKSLPADFLQKTAMRKTAS